MRWIVPILIAAFLALPSCGGGGDSDDDDENVRWSFTYTSSTCSCAGCSGGTCCCSGVTFRASGKTLLVETVPWRIGEPAPCFEPAPPPDRPAIREARRLVSRDVDVIDAAAVPGGVAALVRGPGGDVGIALLSGENEPAVLVPRAARRVVLLTASPLSVRVRFGALASLVATHAD